MGLHEAPKFGFRFIELPSKHTISRFIDVCSSLTEEPHLRHEQRHMKFAYGRDETLVEVFVGAYYAETAKVKIGDKINEHIKITKTTTLYSNGKAMSAIEVESEEFPLVRFASDNSEAEKQFEVVTNVELLDLVGYLELMNERYQRAKSQNNE